MENSKSKPKRKPARRHRCIYCDKTFSSKSHLSRHRKVHEGSPDLKCSFCDYATHHKEVLEKHIRVHTKERPYKCKFPSCSATFSHPVSLKGHQMVHNKGDKTRLKFKCSKCPYKTWNKSNLTQHEKIHSDARPFPCPICPFRGKIKSVLERHHENIHLKSKSFKCPVPTCSYATTQKGNFARHQRLLHKDEEAKEKTLKFKCLKCDYKTAFKENLGRHMMVHSVVKHFRCDLCPFRSGNKWSLKSHKYRLHTVVEPTVECPQRGCNYRGKTKTDIKHHVKVHEVKKPLKCGFPDCNFKTKWTKSLQSHEMIHRKEKPFKCPFCPYFCRQKFNLNAHIRVHTGESPYACPSCAYRGKSSTNLREHLKLCKMGAVVTHKKVGLLTRTSVECKIVDCGFVAKGHSTVAAHYNNIHNLPTVKLQRLQ